LGRQAWLTRLHARLEKPASKQAPSICLFLPYARTCEERAREALRHHWEIETSRPLAAGSAEPGDDRLNDIVEEFFIDSTLSLRPHSPAFWRQRFRAVAIADGVTMINITVVAVKADTGAVPVESDIREVNRQAR
jgi:hypothetical protein